MLRPLLLSPARTSGRLKGRWFSSQLLPAIDNHVGILRIEFHEPSIPATALTSNQRRPRSPEQIENTIAGLGSGSVSIPRKSEKNISERSKKRHDEPPDEYAFHDPGRTIYRTQAFKFRFQVVLALAAVPRIRFGFSPAGWALQSFSHGQPIISPTTSAGKPVLVCPRACLYSLFKLSC